MILRVAVTQPTQQKAPCHAAIRARTSQISWQTTVAHQPTEETPSNSLVCENFLYVFKAARRAARAADSARSPLLPLALPQRRRLTPVGWREKHETRTA